MEPNEVDITHTVKASESNGRLLLKNLDTGETRWLSQVSSEPVPPETPALPTQPEEVEQAIAEMKKKRTRGPSMQD